MLSPGQAEPGYLTRFEQYYDKYFVTTNPAVNLASAIKVEAKITSLASFTCKLRASFVNGRFR
jgi:hypothetical protein